ncbi:Gfo/Idh/MocA family protein [Rhizosaccharibacter radicis]|uniref:Gfo/Idh/MocA family oxidoreductase n=1 Tax=Rhizosaccharibacter radicis TaxID=2782605 RepID=A0ABT1VV63_9PROT|nr:Gfo/Idh/MocA family oxidoreductase [Acetobacteraceae bacterium KSS12]
MTSTGRLRIGVVGAGQIARTRHFPTLLASGDFTPVAAVNPVAVPLPAGLSLYPSLDGLIAAGGVDAVAISTPPQVRYELARAALRAGLHVLLEKPPALTVAEMEDLAQEAARAGRTLFTAWHSMFAGGVAPAAALLQQRAPRSMRIEWREDVEKWHPGVDWFWQPGGLGVFDPGINAFSVVVACMPEPLFVREAAFRVPDGAHTPVAADICFATPTRADGFEAHLDWDHHGEECWNIEWGLEDGGSLRLGAGGARLLLDGERLLDERDDEYPRLYRRFAALIREGHSEVETRPLRLAADCFFLASRQTVGRFRQRA